MSPFSPSIMGIPGIEFRSSSLTAGGFTVSPASTKERKHSEIMNINDCSNSKKKTPNTWGMSLFKSHKDKQGKETDIYELACSMH